MASSKKGENEKEGKKILFKTEDSCIVINNSKLYVVSNTYKDYSPRAIQVIDGLQLELGRSMEDFKQALRYTRLPIMIKLLIEKHSMKQYQIVRMHTGAVDDKVVVTVLCQNDIIKTIAFNRDLVRDNQYRKFNKLSIYHQLVIPYECEGNCSRSEQVKGIVSTIVKGSSIKVEEVEGKQITVLSEADRQTMKFSFISGKNGNKNYALMSVTLIESELHKDLIV